MIDGAELLVKPAGDLAGWCSERLARVVPELPDPLNLAAEYTAAPSAAAWALAGQSFAELAAAAGDPTEAMDRLDGQAWRLLRCAEILAEAGGEHELREVLHAAAACVAAYTRTYALSASDPTRAS